MEAGADPSDVTSPPLSTRSATRKVAFYRVLKDVLDIPDDDLLFKVLDYNGIPESMLDLLSIPDSKLATWSWNDGKEDHYLNPHRIIQMDILKNWNIQLRSVQGKRMVDWLDVYTVNSDAWDEFRVGDHVVPDTHASGPPYSTSGNTGGSSNFGQSRPPISAAAEFRKGIKRDKSHYKEIKDEKQWDDWKRSTISTVYAHGCENILSQSYVPATPDDTILFIEQQKFMYDVWVNTIRTPMGRHYVRKNEGNRDAQAVWRDYANYMRSSTRADIEIEDLMTALTSLRIDSQRGNAQKFILSWLDQLRMYEDLTPISAHFPDNMKKAMLQNAISPLKVFKDVKVSEQIEVARGKGPMVYADYVNLVQQVAAGYDKTQEPQQRRPSRQVNMTEYDNYSWEYEDDPGDDNPFEDYFGSMSVNVTQQNQRKNSNFRRRPSLPKAVWQAMSPDDQMAWDKVSDETKFKIIFAYKDHIAKRPTQYDKRTVNFSEGTPPAQDVTENEEFADAHQEPEPESRILVNAAAGKTQLNPADIRRALSVQKKKKPDLKIDTHTHEVIRSEAVPVYRVSNHLGHSSDTHGLQDRGANGGLAGTNMRVISAGDRRVHVSGIDNHEMTNLRIVSAGAIIPSQRGDVIGIFHQYASTPHGKTIHSSVQFESFGLEVDDRSKKLGKGQQCITTPEGYIFPLDFINGLAYLPMRPYTDEEWRTLPHVVFTSDVDWDPSTSDLAISDDDVWYNALPNEDNEHFFHTFDEHGALRPTVAVATHVFRSEIQQGIHVAANVQTPAPRTYRKYRDYFLRAPIDVIKRTFDATTQYARSGWITGRIFDTHRAPFPALNVRRRNEKVATDTFYADTPAVDDGATCAQFYCGRRSKYVEVFGMKTDSHFIQSLWDTIRRNGAMDVLVSDRAQSEISKKVLDVLRYLCIKDTQSEPHQQHQNSAERRYKSAKFNSQQTMNMSGAPADCWLLCMQYTCFVMNRLALQSLHWRTPFESLNGQTPDISMVYRFKFMDRVYYKKLESRGGSRSQVSDKSAGHFVGFSETVGHPMTYKVLTDDTRKVIYRSRIRLATIDPNLQLDPPVDERFRDNIQDPDSEVAEDGGSVASPPDLLDRSDGASDSSDDDNMPDLLFQDGDNGDDDGDDDPDMPALMRRAHNHLDGDDDEDADDISDGIAPQDTGPTPRQPHPGGQGRMAVIDTNDIIGRTFLTVPQEDGTRMRLRVSEVLDQEEQERMSHPATLKFRAVNGDDSYAEIVSYNQIMDHLTDEDGEDGLWHFKSIDSHQGPILPSDSRYNGSRYNLRIAWENGEMTWEPLSIIGRTDPVSVAIYGQENDLLQLPGWKRFEKLAKRQKKMLRMANQAKLQSFRSRAVFQFGIQVPQSHKQAMELDAKNGNHLWRDSERQELGQIDEYAAFKDLGFKAEPPPGYKRIRVHMVYAIKHDLRRKSRLVADGNLTDVPLESVYSSVVSLRGLRTTIFLAELNQMELWCTDIGNAYLEAETLEKIYVVAGNEFGPLEGHTLLIQKALYGLRSSGARWWERFSDVLTEMGFRASMAEGDIWMRDRGDHYEYIARYVDDLAIASRDPKAITDALEGKYSFKLKGTGPINYHLGCDFYRDSEGTLCMAPKKYIERMIDTYHQIFGEKPRTVYTSPIERGDHPELDSSEELDEDGIRHYQSLIGGAQWVISLGRFDVATSIMTLSSFRAAPRHGHMDRLKRTYGYIARMKHGAIRFRTGIPDYSAMPIPELSWVKTVYGEAREEIPHNAPKPLGMALLMTTYVDANLCHDMTTGKAVTGVLHFYNQTPIDFHTRKQGTVETATYGSEYVAGRTASEQVIDHRISLRYLGVPILGPTYLFGDNKSVVDSSMKISSKLHKRHVLLSYHRVREAIAAGVLYFIHIPGAINPADILSKHWGYTQVKTMLKAMLFWEGDTGDIEE